MDDRRDDSALGTAVRTVLGLAGIAGLWYVNSAVESGALDEWEPALTIVLALVLPVVYLLWQRHRSRAFREAAAGLGLTVGSDLRAMHLPFSILAHRPRSRTVAHGWRERYELVLFEFRTGTGKNTLTHTAAAYRAPGQAVGPFVLRPEFLGGAIANLLGLQDIDFETSPEFSRNYRLTGPDEGEIRALFGLGLLRFFARHGGWTVEAKGEWLLVFRHGRRETPDRLSQFLVESAGVANAVTHAASRCDRPGTRGEEAHHPIPPATRSDAASPLAVPVRSAFTDSGVGRFVSRHRRALFLAGLTIMVVGWGARDLMSPLGKVLMIVAAWTMAAVIAILALRGVDLLHGPTAERE